MAKRIKTAAEALASYQKGMAGAGAAYTAGTAAVQNNPAAAAAAKLDKAAANYQEAISSGRMADALNKVTLAGWKAACQAGAARLASGAQKGAQKYQAAIAKMAPVHAAMQQASAAAGDDPIAKVSAALQVMLDAKKNGMTK